MDPFQMERGRSSVAKRVLVGLGAAAATVIAVTVSIGLRYVDDWIADPAPVVDRDSILMSRKLALLYDRMYREADAAFAQDEWFAPGLRYVDGTIDILEEHVDDLAGVERLVVQAAINQLREDRSLMAAASDLYDAFEAAGGADPSTMPTRPEIDARIRMIYDIRLANHEVHVAISKTEQNYYERMILSGVPKHIAAPEANDYGVRSQVDVQLRMCENERAMLDEVERLLQLLYDRSAEWKPLAGESTIIVDSDELLMRLDERHAVLDQLEAQAKALNRELFTRPME